MLRKKTQELRFACLISRRERERKDTLLTDQLPERKHGRVQKDKLVSEFSNSEK